MNKTNPCPNNCTFTSHVFTGLTAHSNLIDSDGGMNSAVLGGTGHFLLKDKNLADEFCKGSFGKMGIGKHSEAAIKRLDEDLQVVGNCLMTG